MIKGLKAKTVFFLLNHRLFKQKNKARRTLRPKICSNLDHLPATIPVEKKGGGKGSKNSDTIYSIYIHISQGLSALAFSSQQAVQWVKERLENSVRVRVRVRLQSVVCSVVKSVCGLHLLLQHAQAIQGAGNN
jgi:hypothetical protein